MLDGMADELVLLSQGAQIVNPRSQHTPPVVLNGQVVGRDLFVQYSGKEAAVVVLAPGETAGLRLAVRSTEHGHGSARFVAFDPIGRDIHVARVAMASDEPIKRATVISADHASASKPVSILLLPETAAESLDGSDHETHT